MENYLNAHHRRLVKQIVEHSYKGMKCKHLKMQLGNYKCCREKAVQIILRFFKKGKEAAEAVLVYNIIPFKRNFLKIHYIMDIYTQIWFLMLMSWEYN